MIFGSAGALAVAGIRRKLTFENIKKMFLMTVRLNGLIFWILIGAVSYARIVTVSGVGEFVADEIINLDVNRWIILLLMMAIFLVAGMFIDTIAVLLITAPFFLPTLTSLNFDLTWFGILFIIAVCIGNLTPPFGLSIFVMKGVARDLSIREIYSSVWPFVVLFIICLVCVIVFPEIALWLPEFIR